MSETTSLSIELSVNGAQHALRIEPRVSLLDALRDRLHLSGTKIGCAQGACGVAVHFPVPDAMAEAQNAPLRQCTEPEHKTPAACPI